MMLAQGLYEGKEIGDEGATGLITYMRTDSTRVSDDALPKCAPLYADRYGEAFVPAPNIYKTKKDAQDAHEAIRPTSVLRTPEMMEKFLAEDELKLYRLIWMRFVASQMNARVFDQTTIDVNAKGKERQLLYLPRHRQRAEVRRLPEGLRRRQGSEGRRRRRAQAQAARRHRRRDAEVQVDFARAAFHRTAAALQRSHAGQETRSRRRGPAVHLRFHSFHHSGPRVRQKGRRQVRRLPSWAWLSPICCSKASTISST
jgi:hypothetical protein